MFNLRRILGVPSHQFGCVLATRLFLEGKMVDQIYACLRKEGFSDRSAARIVTFLPSAFARIYYRETGYSFPDHFFPGIEAYRSGRSLRYREEPIFEEAMRLAEQLRRDGDWSQVARVVEISAEHQGILEARNQGLSPTGSSVIIYQF